MDHPQRGAVLVTVMVFMLILMAMASGLVNYFLTSEANEVESLLVDVRAYWAQIGHVNYMLSRAAASGVCGTNDNTTNNTDYYCGPNDDDNTRTNPPFTTRTTKSPAGSLQSYLDGDSGRLEIHNRRADGSSGSSSLIDPGSRQWFYPQYSNKSSQYYITVSAVVRDHGTATDGRLRVDVSVVASGTVPVINGLENRADRLTVGFCVNDNKKISSSTQPLTYTYTGCTSGTDASDATKSPPYTATGQEGLAYIQFVMRNAPIPLN